MTPYIEILGAVALFKHELDSSELRSIGRFTRKNIVSWFNSHRGPDWVGVLPVEDFHAVCGDIDIPWATEEGKRLFTTVREKARRAALARGIGKPQGA